MWQGIGSCKFLKETFGKAYLTWGSVNLQTVGTTRGYLPDSTARDAFTPITVPLAAMIASDRVRSGE